MGRVFACLQPAACTCGASWERGHLAGSFRGGSVGSDRSDRSRDGASSTGAAIAPFGGTDAAGMGRVFACLQPAACTCGASRGARASCRPSGVFAWTRATHKHNSLGGAIPARGAEWLGSRGIRGSWRSPAGGERVCRRRIRRGWGVVWECRRQDARGGVAVRASGRPDRGWGAGGRGGAARWRWGGDRGGRRVPVGPEACR